MKKTVKMIALALAGLLFVAVLPASAELSGKNSGDYEPLRDLAEVYGFRIGGCFSYNQLRDAGYLGIMARHFSSITCTNETKAYSMLDQRASKAREDGMPGINFTQADKMIAWAQKNNVKVRGHVLVWDAYMTDWFFREGYDSKNPVADRETVRARMKSYIEQVITHFETEYPGVIYCWDTVNEAIGDNAGEYDVKDPRHLRTVRSGQPNPFYVYAGEDYVEYAFLCAKNTVEALGADIALFYNDYNMFMTDKRTAACALAESINTYAVDENGEYRRLIDGIGMQGYIGGYGTQSGCLNERDIEKIRQSILAYSSLGLEVQVTEMAVRNYDKEQAEKHAAFYGKLFEMFCRVNSEDENRPLTAVCIWGINDCSNLPHNNYSWKLNSPYGGLLDERNRIKTSFDAVYNVLKGEKQ